MPHVVPVPCLSDNYAYLVSRPGSRDAIVVDPSEADPVLEALERENLTLAAILNTHHHYDHVGGNEGIRERLGAVPVYAHVSDDGRVPSQTERVEEGKGFEVAGLSFDVLHVPGHTLGAVSYVVDGAVFTGDTLFVAGCGRLFEGTPEQMYDSLSRKLAKLPAATQVFCGHEYTLANLRFALTVEPANVAMREKLERATAARERGEPTVPSSIGEELATNPFMRCADAAALAAVRRAKDSFR
jgi:hydroxyacylglutathione hydrolase